MTLILDIGDPDFLSCRHFSTGQQVSYILYFVDRSSSYKFLLITNLMHFFMYLLIHFISLHVSSIKCSSSGDRIVLIHHLVWLVCVSDCWVCR